MTNRLIRVGIDVRTLSKPTTGISRYFQEVMRHADLDNLAVFAYSNVPVYGQDFLDHTNLNERYSHLEGNLGRKIWSQSVLPFQIWKDDLDIYWNPAQRMPIIRSSRTKYVATIHDTMFNKLPETMRRHAVILDKFFIPFALKKADKIFAVSQNTKADLEAIIGEVGDKIEVTPLAADFVNAGYVEPKSKKSFSVDAFRILFVGTAEPRKNIDALFDAISRLKFTFGIKPKFLMVGRVGWGGINPCKIAKKYNVEAQFEWWSDADDAQREMAYKTSDLFVYPSLYEGFGLPLLEAQRYSLPVISFDNSSLPEVLNGSGLIVETDNRSALANAIKSVAEDVSLQKKLQNYSFRNQERFAWRKVSQSVQKAGK